MLSTALYLIGNKPPEKDTDFYTLKIRARNSGKVYAQYVNVFIYVPVQLLSNQDVKAWSADRIELIEGNEYLSYYKDNTVKDSVGGAGLGPPQETGPARYDPILPELSRYWEITLKRDIQNLNRNDLIIRWNVYADNAPPTSGEIRVSNIKVVDFVEPDFDALADEEDE